MDGDSYVSYRYKLRAAGLSPIQPGQFLSQTFGAIRNRVTTYPATTTITKSDEFAGASTLGDYISANFQRLNYLTEEGDRVFSGQTVEKDVFLDEDAIPGS